MFDEKEMRPGLCEQRLGEMADQWISRLEGMDMSEYSEKARRIRAWWLSTEP